MAKILTVLFVALVFEALGVVFLKQGIDEITAREKLRQGGDIQVSFASALRLVGNGFVNARVLLGVLFEAIFFAGLLILMGHRDISFVWPLTSLSFVMTTIASILILKEHVSGTRWAGVALIMMGAAFITWSEHHKPVAPPKTVVQPGERATP
jgi:drug/metabolite transporter (DMT)-like permease